MEGGRGGTNGGRVVTHTKSALSHRLLGDCIINADDVIRDNCGVCVWGGVWPKDQEPKAGPVVPPPPFLLVVQFSFIPSEGLP